MAIKPDWPSTDVASAEGQSPRGLGSPGHQPSAETSGTNRSGHPHKVSTRCEQDRHAATVRAKARQAGVKIPTDESERQRKAGLTFVQPVQAGVPTPPAPPIVSGVTVPLWDDSDFGHSQDPAAPRVGPGKQR